MGGRGWRRTDGGGAMERDGMDWGGGRGRGVRTSPDLDDDDLGRVQRLFWEFLLVFLRYESPAHLSINPSIHRLSVPWMEASNRYHQQTPTLFFQTGRYPGSYDVAYRPTDRPGTYLPSSSPSIQIGKQTGIIARAQQRLHPSLPACLPVCINGFQIRVRGSPPPLLSSPPQTRSAASCHMPRPAAAAANVAAVGDLQDPKLG